MIGITFTDLGKRKYYAIKDVQDTFTLSQTVTYTVSLHGTSSLCEIEVCRVTGTVWVRFEGAYILGSVINLPILGFILNYFYGVSK